LVNIGGLHVGGKLFEEDITPFHGKANGSRRSYIHNNGSITISHWEGVLDTEDDKEQLTFKGVM